MGNFIPNNTINRFVVCCTLVVFTFATITPLEAARIPQRANITPNDINFGIRIEKLIEKAKKCFSEKKCSKLTEVM